MVRLQRAFMGAAIFSNLMDESKIIASYLDILITKLQRFLYIRFVKLPLMKTSSAISQGSTGNLEHPLLHERFLRPSHLYLNILKKKNKILKSPQILWWSL